MTDERFPIQGGLTIPKWAAERAYTTYRKLFGCGQSLERLGERGGFGMFEFVLLFEGKHPATFKAGDSRMPRLVAKVMSEVFESEAS